MSINRKGNEILKGKGKPRQMSVAEQPLPKKKKIELFKVLFLIHFIFPCVKPPFPRFFSKPLRIVWQRISKEEV